MAVETLAVDQWLYGVLSGDATLTGLVGGRIYNAAAGAVPQAVTYPYIVFNQSGASDNRYVGGQRIWTTGTWLVKVVGAGGSLSTVGPIYDRIDTLLDRNRGVVTGAQVITCLREQTVQYAAPLSDATLEVHLGGLYRIGVQRVVA